MLSMPPIGSLLAYLARHFAVLGAVRNCQPTGPRSADGPPPGQTNSLRRILPDFVVRAGAGKRANCQPGADDIAMTSVRL